MLVRGVFFFSELAPAHPPLAHSIHASGLVNIFAIALELAPTNLPLAFAVTPPGELDDVLRTFAMGSGGFCFYSSKWYGRLSQPSVPTLWLEAAKAEMDTGRDKIIKLT